jgi:hypothetical protein
MGTPRNRQLVVLIEGEQYYSAQKAQDELGMTYSGLRYQVLAGNIKAEIPKGRKQTYYRAKDVEQISREIKIYSIQRNKPAKFLRVTTREEMRECQEISQALFGVGRDTVDERMKLLEKNPDTYHMLKDENQIIGYTAIMPLKPGKLHDVLKQTIPVYISPDDIEDFSSNKEIDLYLHAIGVKPGFTKLEKHIYGSKLVSGLINLIMEMGRKGVSINTIAARSNMPDGVRLLKGLGFTEIEPLTPERRTFIIEVSKSGIPFVKQYKKVLEANKTIT